MRPCSRSRATGSGSACRDAITTCHPGGNRSATSVSTYWHSRLTTASTWSSTTVAGPTPGSIASINVGTAVTSAFRLMLATRAASTAPSRVSATARPASSTAGSLSPSSQEIQALRGRLRSAHCASRVDLP